MVTQGIEGTLVVEAAHERVALVQQLEGILLQPGIERIEVLVLCFDYESEAVEAAISARFPTLRVIALPAESPTEHAERVLREVRTDKLAFLPFGNLPCAPLFSVLPDDEHSLSILQPASHTRQKQGLGSNGWIASRALLKQLPSLRFPEEWNLVALEALLRENGCTVTWPSLRSTSPEVGVVQPADRAPVLTLESKEIKSGPSLAPLLANAARFDGLAARYDAYRPKPPEAFLDRLTRLLPVSKPRLVVDLGCGTGLSTGVWAARAEKVIGIEPNENMIDWALNKNGGEHKNLHFQKRFSHDTGLPNGCADIVTAVQSVHFMEPPNTIDEVFRILRPGGVFAITEEYRPPMLHREVSKVYNHFIQRLIERCNAYENERPHKDVKAVSWPKHQHVAYMRQRNQFRFLTECLIEATEMGNAERFIGLALSHSGTSLLLKKGFSEKEIGIDDLRMAARRFLGKRNSQWRFIFHTVFAIK